MHVFCEKLNDRASESGWDAIGGDTINMPESDGINKNLITEHGRLTFKNIRDHALN